MKLISEKIIKIFYSQLLILLYLILPVSAEQYLLDRWLQEKNSAFCETIGTTVHCVTNSFESDMKINSNGSGTIYLSNYAEALRRNETVEKEVWSCSNLSIEFDCNLLSKY